MSDLRSKAIRLAASMPKGSSERKALLKLLSEEGVGRTVVGSKAPTHREVSKALGAERVLSALEAAVVREGKKHGYNVTAEFKHHKGMSQMYVEQRPRDLWEDEAGPVMWPFLESLGFPSPEAGGPDGVIYEIEWS